MPAKEPSSEGLRFDGPPAVSGFSAPQSAPDPATYTAPVPLDDQGTSFSRSWGTTFMRWGLAWVVFLAVSVAFGFALGAIFPSPSLQVGDSSGLYYSSSFFAQAFLYLGVFGWWLDHALARAGQATSAIVQTIPCVVIGALISQGPDGDGDWAIGFPPVFFTLFGIAGVSLTHVFTRWIRGSFSPSEDDSYSPSAR